MDPISPSQAVYLPRFVTHDIIASLVRGVKGVIVFSFADRVGFTSYADYYNAYAKLISAINAYGIGTIIAKGTVGDAAVDITTGQTTISFTDYYQNKTYTSVTAREWLYEGVTVVGVSNSAPGTVSVTIRNIPDGVYRDSVSTKTFTASGGRMSLTLADLESYLLRKD
jgi:hypothetical protein